MKTVRLACHAMATRFEIVLHGRDQMRLRAAGEEAIAEINRLHSRLSAFEPKSWIGRLNARETDGPVRVAAELFHLLRHMQRLSDITDGAFDVTIGPLLEIWGLRGSVSSPPDRALVETTLASVGRGRITLADRERTIEFGSPGVKLDLGAVGKGYALDVAGDVLLAAGIESAILHGGTSTVRVIGSELTGDPWKIAISAPRGRESGEAPLGTVSICDESLSVSSIWGRRAGTEEMSVGHVIDPRSGRPVDGSDMAVVVAPRATDADALSTALIVLGEAGIQKLHDHVVGFRGAVIQNGVVMQETETIHVHET